MKIKNKSDTSAEIYISGDIVDDAEGDFLANAWGVENGYEWPAKIKQQLDSLKGKDLLIYINSDGGMVSAGVAMANMIARHDGHTTAIVDGWCCSIATQIFFSADTRKMPSNAYLMIHKPTVSVSGDANDMRKAAEILDVLQDGLETTYRKVAREDVADDYIHDLVNVETWFTGEEAAKIFDIDVLDPSDAVACAGKRPLKFFKAPKDLHFSARDKPHAVDIVDNSVDKYKAEVALALAKGAIAK